MYISETPVQKTGATTVKQTDKFSTVLQMFQRTVSDQAVPDAWAGDSK